ncbi:MAG TPA: peptide deformylase [Bacteroidota bacterium]|nr:peptide deformylase [Bacteroidota bacterium]
MSYCLLGMMRKGISFTLGRENCADVARRDTHRTLANLGSFPSPLTLVFRAQVWYLWFAAMGCWSQELERKSMVRTILQLGNPALRARCIPVRSFHTPDLRALINDLRDTLEDFKARHGFGRGIAAPQIGSPQRVIFINVGAPLALINPVIVKRSRKQMMLWDDCFSFPDLLVKVRRSLSIEVRYQNDIGKRHLLKAEGPLSELLQHEIDHLQGILAVDRAIDSKHIIYKSEYEKWREAHAQVLL